MGLKYKLCVMTLCLGFLVAVSGTAMAFVANTDDVLIMEQGYIGPLHGMAMHGDAKYKTDFKHFDYVNPNAPKGGKMRRSTIGTFDNLNPYIIKGVPAVGLGMTFETLMVSTDDEAFSEYGLLAESIEMPEDRSWVVFNLRKQAHFHDGKPVTSADVVFTFNTLKKKGHPFYRAYYADVKEAIAETPHRVRFDFSVSGNRELPLIMGQMVVLPKHGFEERDFTKTTLNPVMGSGPYKVAEVEAGRRIVYARDPDWWGKDLPVNQGRYNFDEISFDYYRDTSVQLQALFAGEYDFRQERIAKAWATGYDADIVKSGKIVKIEQPHERPQGMQGFIFNTRQDIFKDKDVRKAIGMAFDFEWSNKQFAFGTYRRTKSYFSNSELASSGIPTGAELEILSKFKDQLPPELFTEAFTLPVTDGSGKGMRKYIRAGSKLLSNAGWAMGEDGIRHNYGRRLSFEILSQSPAFERWVGPFIQNLKKMGIEANFRVVDTAQYQSRMDNFSFDMTIGTFGQSLSPGNEQRDYWHSKKADVQGGSNLMGVKDPVVDALIDLVIHASDRDALVATTHALDRVLLWGYYLVPQWHNNHHRLAYWNKFGKPDVAPKYGMGAMDTWWIKESE